MSPTTPFKHGERFLLLIHHSPDGDAVASSLGLYLALKSAGKEADVVCVDPIPKQFQFLPSASKIKRDFLLGDYDVIVTLDCGDCRRTGFSSRLRQQIKSTRKVLINVDHHPKNDLHTLATYNFVDYRAPSTSYLVYHLIKELGVSLDHKIATCLLTGLYTDTGGFKHPNTTSEALKFASLMLSYGARLNDITSNIIQPVSATKLKLWGLALSRIRHHPELNIISTFLTHSDITSIGASENDAAGIATLLNSLPVRLAFLVIQQSDGEIKVRMRTKEKDISPVKLASYLGGGGRRQSAGFSVNHSLVLS